MLRLRFLNVLTFLQKGLLKTFIFLLCFPSSISFSQTLIINEVSQGESGTMEYVEFVVVDTAVSYNCSSSVPPCIDIRGWIIDDNSGYHGPSGVASGACRFSFDPLWSCVPLGTIIVIYNDSDPNNQLPADDVSLSDGNCSIVAPISSSLFESNSTTPGASACSYPNTGWTTGGNWTNIVMANSGDCFRIVNLAGCEVFSVCWDDNNQNNMIYFQGGATSGTSATNTVYYFNNGDPTLTINWTVGCADQPNCGQQDQTPGAPNNSVNADYISQFNNGCTPITPIAVISNVDQNATCICDGQASAIPSGSIPGYTYEWFDNSFTSIGQTDSIAIGLCAGTYHVIATSSIGCSDTALVSITSSGSGIIGIASPPNDSTDCASSTPSPFLLFSEFLNEGGALNGGLSDLDTTSFTLTSVSSNGNVCPEIISRTYEITDSCGTVFTATHSIVISDNIAPTATAPNPVTVQCIADIPAVNIADVTGVSDNCTANPAVTHVSDVSDNNTCAEIISRTYDITDDCGNTTTVTQTITIDDNIAPTASNPATTTVECATDVPAIDPAVVIDEADNCTLNPTVTFLSETSNNAVCNGEQLTRTYEIADDCGNTTTVTHTIIIDSYTPTFTVSGTDPTVCGAADGFITISGLDPSTDFGFEFNGNPITTITTNGAGEYVITGLSAGSYTSFTVSDVDCPACSTTDGQTITLIDPNVPIVDAGNNQTVCEGEQVTLVAANPDGAIISWDNGIADGVPFTQAVGTITYTVTADLLGCISTDQVDITVNPLPNVDAGNDLEICQGDQIILAGSGADSYIWDNGVINGQPIIPTQTTTYTLTGSTLGCENTDELTVTIVENPIVLFEADTTQGCVPLTVNFSNNTQGNISNCRYIFSDGTVVDGCDISHTFDQSGCYDVTLEVENSVGCISTSTIQNYICIEDYPIADFDFEPGELSNFNNQANFINSSIGGTSYYWTFGDGESSSSINPVHAYNIETNQEEYEVTLITISDFSCSDTISKTIPVIEELIFYVPNTFTPDDDNHNPTFKPVFTSGFDPQDYTLLIFNRWGEVIFESRNANIGWDGTFGAESNEIVKDGTYVWKIEFKTKYTDERKVEVGHVNILR